METFYRFLNDNHYFWDRKDDNHIWVALNGYRCYDERRTALEAASKQVKAVLMQENWDSHSGKTFYVFKHR